MEAGEICFNQSANQLQQFLKVIRFNYNKVFVDWARYSLDYAKFMAYEEVNCVSYISSSI